MLGVDLQTITSQIWARLASDTDAPALAVRAVLGAGASSIIHAKDLDKESLPARPFMALRGGTLGGQSGQMRPFVIRWWVYDDPGQGYWRINGLVPLIEQVYTEFCIPHGRVVVGPVGDEWPDLELDQFTRSIQLTYTTRG